LQKRLGHNDYVWKLTRHRSKLRQAQKIGYISLSGLIAEARKPDFIKEFLMREASIIEALPETKSYKTLHTELCEAAFKVGMTLDQFLDGPGIGSRQFYRDTRAAWAQRKWDVELFASDCLRVGKVLPAFMMPPQAEPERGFNTLTWKVRKRRMKATLSGFWPDNLPGRASVDELLELREIIISGNIPDHTDFYIPRSRLGEMCSMSIQLEAEPSDPNDFAFGRRIEEDYPPFQSAIDRKNIVLQENPGTNLTVVLSSEGIANLVCIQQDDLAEGVGVQ
jgi:hypothetical protein